MPVVTETPPFGKRSAGTLLSIAGTWHCAPASTRAAATAVPKAPVPPVMTTWQSFKLRMVAPRLASRCSWAFIIDRKARVGARSEGDRPRPKKRRRVDHELPEKEHDDE